ncbi:YrhB domain-containing protein [Streptomyces sp. NPDC048290]|uniref:YrhB domain-containing protein n=1 Tax=Streptomyces sp. NPDC048290 TaxID=3155811 RepID=UPI003425D7AA
MGISTNKSFTGRDTTRMAVSRVARHDLVWLVAWTSAEYLRTGDPRFAPARNGPYLVGRLDGSL